MFLFYPLRLAIRLYPVSRASVVLPARFSFSVSYSNLYVPEVQRVWLYCLYWVDGKPRSLDRSASV